jgi:hypothetical protein
VLVAELNGFFSLPVSRWLGLVDTDALKWVAICEERTEQG